MLRWLVVMCALLSAGCTIIIRKPVNDSPELRWWLFSNYGAREICPELRRQGVPLRLDPRSPAVGRFFPNRCQTHLDQARRLVTVSVGGTGYGYLPVSGRVGFALDATVEYRMDFRMASQGVYVWGIPHRTPQPPNLRILSMENRLATMASSFGIGNSVGEQLVRGELYRGFTVLHTDRGNLFALGIIRPPHRPFTPFSVKGGHYVFANETVTVAMGQRDFLGPFPVMERGQRLRLRFVTHGAPAEVMVVNRFTGDQWRGVYESGAPLGPPPGPVLAGGPIGPGRPTVVTYPLPVGSYYVVIDNTAQAGQVPPRGAATVSYVAELVD